MPAQCGCPYGNITHGPHGHETACYLTVTSAVKHPAAYGSPNGRISYVARPTKVRESARWPYVWDPSVVRDSAIG